jgi:hypothetical protein
VANTRFTSPILYSGKHPKKWLRDAPMGLNSLDHVVIWDDFTEAVFNATDTWTVVKDSSASVALVADSAGGEVILSSQTLTDDDGASIQGNEIFLPAAGRKIWFATRMKLADATQQELCIGLTQNFATDPEAMLTASNRIVFQKNDGATALLCKTEVADSETSTTTTVDVVAATYNHLAFVVDGTGKVDFFIDGNLVATHTTVPATELAAGAYSLSGVDTGTKTMTLDYILAAATR